MYAHLVHHVDMPHILHQGMIIHNFWETIAWQAPIQHSRVLGLIPSAAFAASACCWQGKRVQHRTNTVPNFQRHTNMHHTCRT